MERAFAQNCNEKIQQSPEWPWCVDGASDAWLRWLGDSIGPMLSRQAEFLPSGLDVGLFSQEDESFDGILDLLADSTPEQISRWLEIPIILGVIEGAARNGSHDWRNRARAILTKWTMAKRGRRALEPGKNADAMIERKVTQAEEHLKLGWEYVRENRSDGDREKRDTLLRMGYQGDEVSVLIDAVSFPVRGHRKLVGEHRKLGPVAMSLVSQRSGIPIESISARVSRSRKRARRGK